MFYHFNLITLKPSPKNLNFSRFLVEQNIVQQLFKCLTLIKVYDKLLQETYNHKKPFYGFSLFSDCLVALHQILIKGNTPDNYNKFIKKFDEECHENIRQALINLFEAPSGLKMFLKTMMTLNHIHQSVRFEYVHFVYLINISKLKRLEKQFFISSMILSTPYASVRKQNLR